MSGLLNAVPIFSSALPILADFLPERYERYDKQPPSERSKQITTIIDKIPGKKPPIKIIDNNDPNCSVLGSNLAKKFFLFVSPDIEDALLPWAVTHELSHILHDDLFNLRIARLTAAVAGIVIPMYLFQGSIYDTFTKIFCSFSTMLAADLATDILYGRFRECRADQFANAYCREEELKQGIQLLKKLVPPQEKEGLLCRLGSTHPSAKSRIAHIQQELKRRGKED